MSIFLRRFGDVRFEPPEDLALRAGDVGGVGVAVLAVEDDLAAVGVRELDPAPRPGRVVVLLRGVDVDRTGLVSSLPRRYCTGSR